MLKFLVASKSFTRVGIAAYASSQGHFGSYCACLDKKHRNTHKCPNARCSVSSTAIFNSATHRDDNLHEWQDIEQPATGDDLNTRLNASGSSKPSSSPHKKHCRFSFPVSQIAHPQRQAIRQCSSAAPFHVGRSAAAVGVADAMLDHEKYARFKRDFMERFEDKQRRVREASTVLCGLREEREQRKRAKHWMHQQPFDVCESRASYAESDVKTNCMRATPSMCDFNISVAVDRMAEEGVRKFERSLRERQVQRRAFVTL